MPCHISKLIHSSVETLDEAVSVQAAAALMARNDLDSVLVSRQSEVIGLFTEKDMIKRVVGAGKDPATLTLGDVCSRKLVSVHEDMSCENAIKTMHSNHCRRLLVYRGDSFRGMVQLSGIAREMAAQKARSNLMLNLVGGTTVLVTLIIIGFGLYQLPQMARIAMAVIN